MKTFFLHRNFQSLEYESRRIFMTEDMAETFEKTVEEGTDAKDESNQKLDKIKIGKDELSEAELKNLNPEQFTKALNKINNGAKVAIGQFFEKAYGKKDAENEQSARQDRIRQNLAVLEYSAKSSENRNIDAIFQEYLGVFQVMDNLGKNPVKKERGQLGNASSILKKDGGLESGIKNSAEVETFLKAQNISLVSQEFTIGGKTVQGIKITRPSGGELLFKTGIKFMKPVYKNDGKTIKGVFLIDGDGDMSIISAGGKAMYVNESYLAQTRDGGRTSVGKNEGIHWGYQEDGTKSKESKKGVSKTSKGEEDAIERTKKDDTLRKFPEEITEAIVEIRNNPEKAKAVLGDMNKDVVSFLRNPNIDSILSLGNIIKKHFPKLKLPNRAQFDTMNRVLNGRLGEKLIEKSKREYQALFQLVLSHPKMIETLPVGEDVTELLDQSQRKQVISDFLRDATGKKYDVAQIPEIEKIEIKEHEGKKVLVIQVPIEKQQTPITKEIMLGESQFYIGKNIAGNEYDNDTGKALLDDMFTKKEEEKK